MTILSIAVVHICALGFISGKKKAIIPWAKVSMDPTSWINEECYPSGFQWADPSKIRVGQVFDLLGHWRQREAAGLSPLIWNHTCDLLADVEPRSTCAQDRRQRPSDEDDSEEEDFGNELRQISETDSEVHHSPSPHWSPSLDPTHLEGLEYAGPGSPPFRRPSSIPHHSCMSDIYFLRLSSHLHDVLSVPR
jgi:hypothetical protein